MMTQRTRARRPKLELESLDDRTLPSAFGSGFFGALAAERASLVAQRQEMMAQRQEMMAQRREMIVQRQSLLAARRASMMGFGQRGVLAAPAAAPFQGQTPVFVGNMPVNPFPTASGYYGFINTPSGPAGLRATVAPMTTTASNTTNMTATSPTVATGPMTTAATPTSNDGGTFQGQTPTFVGNMPVNPFPTASGYYRYINTPSGPAGLR